MRVNRPNPTSRTPVASGSRVPACPTRRWPKMRRQRDTTSWEVQPASLSTTTMPVVAARPRSAGVATVVTVNVTGAAPAVVRGVVALGGRRIVEPPQDLLHPLATGHCRVRGEGEMGGALKPH